MANGVGLINMSELSSEVTKQVVSSISPLVTIFKVVGIAVLVYVIFLILKILFRWRTMSKIGKISRNVEQINEKLDILIKRKSGLKESKGKLEERIKKKKGKK